MTKIFQQITTLQVVELTEVAPDLFDFIGCHKPVSRTELLGAGWCELLCDPGYRGFPETVPVSAKFQAAGILARHLETFNRPKDWNFADAVTLEIHEELLRLVDRGEGAEFLNQFAAVGGEILDYNPSSSLVPAAFFTQLMLGNQPTDAPTNNFFCAGGADSGEQGTVPRSQGL